MPLPPNKTNMKVFKAITDRAVAIQKLFNDSIDFSDIQPNGLGGAFDRVGGQLAVTDQLMAYEIGGRYSKVGLGRHCKLFGVTDKGGDGFEFTKNHSTWYHEYCAKHPSRYSTINIKNAPNPPLKAPGKKTMTWSAEEKVVGAKVLAGLLLVADCTYVEFREYGLKRMGEAQSKAHDERASGTLDMINIAFGYLSFALGAPLEQIVVPCFATAQTAADFFVETRAAWGSNQLDFISTNSDKADICRDCLVSTLKQMGMTAAKFKAMLEYNVPRLSLPKKSPKDKLANAFSSEWLSFRRNFFAVRAIQYGIADMSYLSFGDRVGAAAKALITSAEMVAVERRLSRNNLPFNDVERDHVIDCLCECQELSFKHIAECITQRSDGIVRRTSQQVKILLYNHFHYLQDRIEERDVNPVDVFGAHFIQMRNTE